MNPKQIVALALRVFSIALALYAIEKTISLATYFSARDFDVPGSVYGGFLMLLFLLAIGLWKFPLTVAGFLTTSFNEGDASNDGITVERIEVAAFAVVGLYLLFGVLSDLAYWSVIVFLNQRNPMTQYDFKFEDIAGIISTFVELAFVLLLLFGGKRIGVFLRKLRYGNKT